jgi:hypothetical protein
MARQRQPIQEGSGLTNRLKPGYTLAKRKTARLASGEIA